MSQRLPVIFRTFKAKDGGDTIALFPTLPGTSDPATCMSYQHVGQHGTATERLTLYTQQATRQEAATLRRELESKPYNYRLRQYRRLHPSFRRAREDALNGTRPANG